MLLRSTKMWSSGVQTQMWQWLLLVYRIIYLAAYFFHTGVSNKTRIIDIRKLSVALAPWVCEALIVIHAFSGCDSTSAFYGKGKRKTFFLACESQDYLKAFQELGSTFDFDTKTFKCLYQFVCDLYYRPPAANVNEARYKAFCMTSSALPEWFIPPHHWCPQAAL